MTTLQKRPPAVPPTERSLEFAFDAEDFRQISETLYADAGIALSEQKMPLVYSRLVKRLRALGLASFKDYCALIRDKDGLDERQQMMAALTTNVTRFMREPHHFEHLKSAVLPTLLKSAQQGGRVRLWSAACSSGQEPYSLALTVLAQMPNAGDRDVRILATDIDPNMVAIAKAGTYAESELSALGKADRTRFFQNAGPGAGTLTVSPDMRRLIAFNELNLIGSWPMKGAFQVIFCRNVAIYFDEPTQAKLWARFAAALGPGGHLYIGHSERLSGPAREVFTQVGPTIYALTGDRT